MWRFALAVLAAWRVTHLLAKEDGPGDIIYKFRWWLGQSFLGRLMDCFNCMSLWISAPAALFVSLRLSEWFLTWLAISGAACLLERVTQERGVLPSSPDPSQGDLNHVLWSESRATDRPSGPESENDPELQEKHPG
jgi:hypothetical protein